MIRTVVRPNGSRFFAYVYCDDRFLFAGPTRDTPEEAEGEAMRFYHERAHEPRPMRAEEEVTYHADKDVPTVSSYINGKPASYYW